CARVDDVDPRVGDGASVLAGSARGHVRDAAARGGHADRGAGAWHELRQLPADDAVDAAARHLEVARAGPGEAARLVLEVDGGDRVDERRLVARDPAEPESRAALRVRDLLKPSLLLVGHRRADEIVERDRRALAEGPENARAGECEPDRRPHVPLAGDVA